MKRGRPKGSRNKSTITREKLAMTAGPVAVLTMEVKRLREDFKHLTRRVNEVQAENRRLRHAKDSK